MTALPADIGIGGTGGTKLEGARSTRSREVPIMRS